MAAATITVKLSPSEYADLKRFLEHHEHTLKDGYKDASDPQSRRAFAIDMEKVRKLNANI